MATATITADWKALSRIIASTCATIYAYLLVARGGKWVGSRDEEPTSWGTLDSGVLHAAGVETVCCDAAHALDGPFTTGNIARRSFEQVLPNTLVEPTPADHFR